MRTLAAAVLLTIVLAPMLLNVATSMGMAVKNQKLDVAS